MTPGNMTPESMAPESMAPESMAPESAIAAPEAASRPTAFHVEQATLADIDAIVGDAEEHAVRDWRSPWPAILDAGPAWTLRPSRPDALPVAVAGVILHWIGRIQVWAVVRSGLNAAERLALHRRVARGLPDLARRHDAERVEAIVDRRFTVGRRWARRLGFTEEAVMRRYLPGGGDAVLAVRYAPFEEESR